MTVIVIFVDPLSNAGQCGLRKAAGRRCAEGCMSSGITHRPRTYNIKNVCVCVCAGAGVGVGVGVGCVCVCACVCVCL